MPVTPFAGIYGGMGYGPGFGAYGGAAACTIKDVLHQQAVHVANGQQRLGDKIGEGHRALTSDVVQNRFEDAKSACDLGKSVLENRFEVERAVKDLESRSTERLLDVRRELADRQCAADIRREQLEQESLKRWAEDRLERERCCCRLEAATREEGQRTRDLIERGELERLRAENSALRASAGVR